MSVEFRHYTDPSCEWSWAVEPQLRRLSWEFGDAISLRPTMVGLARTLEPGDHAKRLAAWLDSAAQSRMPCDPRLWTKSPISSTYPACLAVLAAAEQGHEAANRYLRRAREALLCERRKLDHPDALVALAGPAGLDQARFEIDLRSNAITEAFGADLERSRALEGGHERLPVLAFAGDDAEARLLRGVQPYEAYRRAALDAGARPVTERGAEPLEALARFGRCATRELEELSGRPSTVLRAELWALAREWRVKPEPILTGVLWELA